MDERIRTTKEELLKNNKELSLSLQQALNREIDNRNYIDKFFKAVDYELTTSPNTTLKDFCSKYFKYKDGKICSFNDYQIRVANWRLNEPKEDGENGYD